MNSQNQMPTGTITASGYIQSGDSKIYYEVAGDSENETLILSHAGLVDSRMWDDQWTVFAAKYHVVRFDMPGYGKSDPVTAPRVRRDDLLHVMDELKINHAYLLGCSLSGEIVIDFTLQHPERVKALIPVSAVPGGFQMQGEPPAALMEMFGALQQGDLKRVSELQIQLWVDGAFRQPDQVDPIVRHRAAEMNWIAVERGTWAAAEASPLNPLNPPAVGRLSEIKVPVLAIAGALDHPEILRAADVMIAEMPDARKFILLDCAHVPNMEQPDAFNQAVLSFLAQL